MAGRRTLLLGATLAMVAVPPALGTASASARPVRSHPVRQRALAFHRAENRWHLRQMDGHAVTFARWNRTVHRRFPLAGPFADRAVHATHMIHGGMAWADNSFLWFHERAEDQARP